MTRWGILLIILLGFGGGMAWALEPPISLDRDAVLYYLSSVQETSASTSKMLNGIRQHIEGLNLVPQETGLAATVEFDKAFDISLMDPGNAKLGQLYEIQVPSALKFLIVMTDGVIHVMGAAENLIPLQIDVKIPLLPDAIYLHQITADLASGDVHVEAGAVDDFVTVVADGKLWNSDHGAGVDWWGSLLATLSSFSFHF